MTLGATNATGTNSATLVLAVLAQPVITSTNAITAQVGQFFYYMITGNNTFTSFGATMDLPAGLVFNSGSGIISGTAIAADLVTVGLNASYLTPDGMNTGTSSLMIAVIAASSDTSGTFQAGIYPSASYAAPSCYIVNDGTANVQANQTFNTGTNSGTTMPVGRTSGTSSDRALLAFDLTSLPANATITSAILTLNSSSGTGAPVQVEVHQSATPFDPTYSYVE